MMARFSLRHPKSQSRRFSFSPPEKKYKEIIENPSQVYSRLGGGDASWAPRCASSRRRSSSSSSRMDCSAERRVRTDALRCRNNRHMVMHKLKQPK